MPLLVMTSFLTCLDGTFPFFRFATLCLILILGYIPQILKLWPDDMVNPVIFNIALCLILWTFILVCTTDPGQVKPSYVPIHDVQVRYCRECRHFKPPRTHHCRRCKRCILKMDHHCPWLNSCIGHHNHAVFIRFMTIVSPTSAWLSHQLFKRIMQDYHAGMDDMKITIIVVIGMMTAGVVAFAVTCLLLYQLWCLCENITTIESWDKARLGRLTDKHELPPVEFPYDLQDFTLNYKQVLGDNILLWLWPTYSTSKDGHNFRVNEDCEEPVVWPPKLVVPSRPAKKKIEKQQRDISKIPEDELSYEDYAAMGLIDDSEDDMSDYANSEGEKLGDYGVDDQAESNILDQIIDEKRTTIAMLLRKKRQEQSN